MRSSRFRTVALLSAVALAWAAALAASAWSLLTEPTRAALQADLMTHGAAVALLLGLLLPVAFALALRAWSRQWSVAAARMADEVAIVAAGQGMQRVQARGSPELAALGAAINQLADQHARLNAGMATQVAEAGGRLAQESQWRAQLLDTLTTRLLAQLPQGVLLCRADGRVLLYNDAAARLLGDGATPLGLGRPVADWIDAGALAQVQAALQAPPTVGTRHAAQVVVARGSGARWQWLRCRFTALRAADIQAGGDPDTLEGCLLVLQDLNLPMPDAGRRERAMFDLTEGGGRTRAGAWPGEDMRAADLALALQWHLAALPLRVEVDPAAPVVWLRLDCLALVQALSYLAGAVRASLGVEVLQVGWARSDDGMVELDLRWNGPPLPPGQLARWEGQPIASGAQGVAVTLLEVLARQGAEVSGLGEGAAGPPGGAGIRLRLPVAGAQPAGESEAAPVPGRPVYYDFALLQQRSARGDAGAQHQQPLAELIFTVFDTETTGLHPAEGDEIISIGAYRIVAGRLREHDRFERLIEPRRPVRESAQAVHGISNAMLAGQSPAEAVLPVFARFCADSVLVAHNAAFDLRFLELARERSGAAFDQPVLDTLLLSSILHPGHTGGEHRLEAIAQRLGIAVEGRHTALGDAETTGRVFLAMLPLLAARGIVTLGQALAASQQSAYAQLKY